ncbi:PREDICTED: tyrosine-protein kinase receptor ver-3-like [Eufriesea mexicana]|uniref:tyrosine-protein kinase receptor ver-3-like n=1 Tax=Eufriesea mexicana TaxID=516756 RepID=UPI00083C5E35|nr:PREDICTED: tyrosine-protein kinase receptor ver-3-like [Eufriesea mexicana]
MAVCTVYPQVNQDTQADINLQCTKNDMMVIKFNSGRYIIERSISEYEWTFVNLTKGSFAIITNLTAGTMYRYRLYNMTENGISRPETSDWFPTFAADYMPLPVKNLTPLEIETDTLNECKLSAEIAFEPAEDRSCIYYVSATIGGNIFFNFFTKVVKEFQFNVHHLEMGQNINVTISSVNVYDTEVSAINYIVFDTPTCLEYYADLTICRPDMVKGLRTEHIYRDKDLYDLGIFWDKSSPEPDNYIIMIDLHGDGEQIYTRSVPGNNTEDFISKVKLGPQYIISIVADSLGGRSIPESIKNIIRERTITAYEYFYTAINFNQRDLPIEVSKKLLSQYYDPEINNSVSLTLTNDQYEFRPKLLAIKSVLGSGAYGIVMLGSLQEKFDNVIDVAVKMLKDNATTEELENFRKEMLIMKFVNQHPNIVSLIGCCHLYDKPVLVVEYCCKGDLQTYLKTIWQNMVSVAFNHKTRLKLNVNDANSIKYISKNAGGKHHNYENIQQMIENHLYDIEQDISQSTEFVTANDLLNFARQIATGMEFLSSNRIVHRDLAARNILVCADRKVKISDFGLSRDVYQENLYKKTGSGKLPLKWMAIEAITHQTYTTYSDVWSFGILLWEIVTMGAIPYPGISTSAILKLLKSGYRMEQPVSCSVELYNIMFSCWNERPQSRPVFTELKESLDKLLSYQSDNKYLNMNEMLYEAPEQ